MVDKTRCLPQFCFSIQGDRFPRHIAANNRSSLLVDERLDGCVPFIEQPWFKSRRHLAIVDATVSGFMDVEQEIESASFGENSNIADGNTSLLIGARQTQVGSGNPERVAVSALR